MRVKLDAILSHTLSPTYNQATAILHMKCSKFTALVIGLGGLSCMTSGHKHVGHVISKSQDQRIKAG